MPSLDSTLSVQGAQVRFLVRELRTHTLQGVAKDTMVHSVYLCGLCELSRVHRFATLWTIACQTPLSMEFSRQEYWTGLPFPSPEVFVQLNKKAKHKQDSQ